MLVSVERRCDVSGTARMLEALVEQAVVGLKLSACALSFLPVLFFKNFLHFGATQIHQSEQRLSVLRRLAVPCHVGTTHQRSKFTHLAVRSATL